MANKSHQPSGLADCGTRFVAKIQENMQDIIGNFALQHSIGEFQILEVGSTAKSVYGKIGLSGGKELFFKISTKPNIAREVEAFGSLPEWDHLHILASGSVGEFGIYFQEYHDGADGKCLLENISQQIISKDAKKAEAIIQKCRGIFDSIFKNYESSVSMLLDEGGNDKFFRGRAVESDWLGKYLDMELYDVGGNGYLFKDLVDKRIVFNGMDIGCTFQEILKSFAGYFESTSSRLMVLSQGDITENNITVDGKYFDFETGGYNDLYQDMAITLHYLLMAGSYITPKYSSSFQSLRVSSSELLDNQSMPKSNMLVRGDRIHFECEYALPLIKQKLVSEYIGRVLESMGSLGMVDFDKFKQVLAFRFIGAKQITQLANADRILLLSICARLFSCETLEEGLSWIDSKVCFS